jgi:beta-ureidopropionase / N-carbamoyl-L-amino-acid hydrolase
VITAEGIAARLAPLDAIGIGPEGVTRLAWTEEDAASRAWFEQQAQRGGLSVRRDPAGSLWACPEAPPPWWGVGSHLDSVRGGGRFDGPLGVACAFEIAACTERPLAVISFADEEGARFNTPTFGSKALAGRLDVPAVLARRDDGGVSVGDAMRDAGVDPGDVLEVPAWASRLSGFVEVHIDQSTDVARAGVPVGIVSSLAARLRLEVELRGRADHSGTTPPSERRDALAAAARLIVAAQDSAGPVTVTTSRLLVAPNALTTIPANVRLWIDARALGLGQIDSWLRGLERAADRLEASSGVEISVGIASRSDGTPFSQPLRSALGRAGRALLGADIPEVVCFAGHDAGVLAGAMPAAMVLVRNATGVSHSPEESVELEDAAVAARVVAEALAHVEGGGQLMGEAAVS